MVYCTKCKRQGVGCTNNWKLRLANYKSQIKKCLGTCNIVIHFVKSCNDTSYPCQYLRFILLDRVDNVQGATDSQIEQIMMTKDKFWIGNLCCIHQGLNGYHDWRRERRNQKHNVGYL